MQTADRIDRDLARVANERRDQNLQNQIFSEQLAASQRQGNEQLSAQEAGFQSTIKR